MPVGALGDEASSPSTFLLHPLSSVCLSVELRRQLLRGPSAKGLLKQPTGLTAGVAREPFGLKLGLSLWRDDHFDRSIQGVSPFRREW